MATKRPFFVLVPGASQNPAHYGLLSHLLQISGYPVLSALLPYVAAAGNVYVHDDMQYVREKMIIPILDHEEHDVILIMHSYSSVPGSASARNLSKPERINQGQKTGIVGQIYIAALLPMGGDGKDILGAFGGHYPPHITPSVSITLSSKHFGLYQPTFVLHTKIPLAAGSEPSSLR
jgi:hypothetical protein